MPTQEPTKPTLSKRLWRLVRLPLTLLIAALVLWLGMFWWGKHPNASSVANASKPTQRANPFPPHRLSKNEAKALLGRRQYLLRKVLSGQAGVKAMPGYLPPQFKGEWAIVSHSMLGVALSNLAYLIPSLRNASQRQLDALIKRTLSPSMKAFDQRRWRHDPLKLTCQHGHIGYLGHLNMLLAARHSLGHPNRYTSLYHRVSKALVRKVKRRKSWVADTYPHERYTSDHAVVMASLALYDRFFPKRATGFARQWLRKMHACCRDPKTGLLRFKLRVDGKPMGSSRGSGAAWDLYYLSHVDIHYARRQFKKLKQHFVTSVLTITGLREWPKGIHRSGDVDSGPLIFGLSPAGTGFAIGITRLAGDSTLLNQLLTTADLAGISIKRGKQQYYLLAPLVGEAILLAMRTAVPWDRRYQPKAKPPTKPTSQPRR